MDSGHGTIMTCVHCLKHIQCFTSAALTHNNAVWAHTQGVDQQLANGNFTFAFNIGWSLFKANNMRLMHLKFSRIFNGDHAFVFRNERRKHVQKRRFTGTCST